MTQDIGQCCKIHNKHECCTMHCTASMRGAEHTASMSVANSQKTKLWQDKPEA